METGSRWKAKRYLVLLCPFLVSACALPLPIQIASWTMDGLSFLITDKSVSDHGISMVMGEDCALYREFTEGQVCRTDGDAATLVAEADDAPLASDVTPDVTAEELASFETAAGLEESAAAQVRVPAAMRRGTEVASVGVDIPFVDDWTSARPEMPVQPAMVSEINSKPIPVKVDALEPADGKSVIRAAEDAVLVGGLYFSLGSFRREVNAKKLAVLCHDLSPAVMPVEYQGKTFFRVVVGPVRVGQKPSVQRKIKAAGFYDTWTFTQTAANIFPHPG